MKRLILFPVIACFALGANAASWVVIGTDPNGEMSIDMDSVVPGERYVEAVTRYAQKTPSTIEGKEYFASITHARFDCRHRTYAAREHLYYPDQSARKPAIHAETFSNEDLKFRLPGKNTHGEEVVNVACEKGGARK